MLSLQIISSLPHPAFVINPEGTFVNVNDRASEWLKVRAQGTIPWDKGLGVLLNKTIEATKKSGKPHADVFVGATHGDLRPIYFSVVPVNWENKDYYFCQAFLVSEAITDKLKTETGLSTTRVELALRARRVGFFDWNIKDNNLFWDKMQYEIFGIKPEDFSNTYEAWESLLTEETAETARRELQEALEGTRDYDTEFEILTKSGQKRIIRASAVMIRDEDGNLERMVGLNWDVTHRRILENQFFEQAFLNRKITDTVPSFIIVANLKTQKFDFFNSQLAKMVDLKESELRNLSFSDIGAVIVDEDRHKYSEFLSRIPSLEDNEVVESELWLRGNSGLLRCLNFRAQIFERDRFGVPESMIISGNDVSEERRILMEAEKDRAKAFNAAKMASLGEMAGGIAHEINNPLTVIVGKAETLRKLLTEEIIGKPKVAEALDKIIATCQRIAKITRGMRTISRTEANEKYQPTMVSTVVDELVILCNQRMVSHFIDFKIGHLPQITMDLRPVQLSQILLNLLNNAVDAVAPLEDKWITLDFKETKDEMKFIVTDSGGPIPREIAARMMEPFYTTKDIGKGTGLGLSISASLANQHGGSLVYDSESRNTRFVLTLPKFQNNKFT